MQLIGAHVHRVDFARAALKQAIREAPGGSTRIETNAILRVHMEGIQATLQLQSPPADEGQRFAPQPDIGGLIHRGASLGDGPISDKHIPRQNPRLG